MKYLNKYTYLVIGLILLAVLTVTLIIPNFQREEFSQEVIEDIVEGVTTTTEVSIEEIAENENNEEANQKEDLEISKEEEDKIEKLLINNNIKEDITDFDVYMLIGSDERSGQAIETRG